MEELERMTLTAPCLYDPAVEALIRPVGREVCYPANKVFSRPGDRLGGIYYILEGRTKHYMDNENGSVKLLYTLTKGWFFGETPLLLGLPTGLWSQTEEETRLCLLPYPQCSRLMEEQPPFRDALMRCLAHKTLMLRYETASLTFNSCKDRLKRLLCASVDMERESDPGWYELRVRYTHHQLGEIVGVARVTISRQLAELAGEGFLRTVNRRLQVNREQYHQYIGEKGKALPSSLP